MKTIRLPNYQIMARIYESANSIVCRAVRNKDGRLVILKILWESYPSPGEMARYQQEFEILRGLNIAVVVSAHSLEKHRNTLILVTEDFGGESLRHLMTKPSDKGGLKGISVPEFLSLGIEMTDSLEQIHAKDIIHKDINPSNIVWNPGTNQLKIIDFGIATRLPRETPALRNPEQLEGTLAYLSPEQTGRINRSVDYRTDLYSLGVTFYEMLTGELPFTAADAMELVHCHIARTPVPVCDIRPDVPKIVSDIVMRLLEKNAEDRYQSAFGVKADMEECLKTLRNLQTLRGSNFELAQNDFPGRFRIPQKLYGREHEISTLLRAFERVSRGAAEMILVAGYSGVGKTALVHEVHRPMTEKRGYFAAGKFDQFRRDIPYSGLSHALNGFCDYLLTESTAQLSQWREKILDAVANNGQVLTNVIPQLEQVVGPQPAVAQVGADESQNRLNQVCQNFFKAIGQAEHPFILFMDDLQWADSASLSLLRSLMTEAENQHVLIIGAYRDNEVDPAHPLMILLEDLQKANAAVSTVHLQNLSRNNVSTLIAAALMSDTDFVRPLTDLVCEKTRGNAFFTHEFLKTLYQKELLTFDPGDRKWQWDLSEIAALGITDNVAELMAGKIGNLPAETQETLKLAACIGNSFDLGTLSLITPHSRSHTLARLWQAMEEGLIDPLDDNYRQVENQKANPRFKFQHDRMQQAAYALIPGTDRPGLHYQIGQLLMADTAHVKDNIFDIVDHLNFGIQLIGNPTEKTRIAQLNLQAGRKAKSSAAYKNAITYLNAGMELLSDRGWEQEYRVTLDLHTHAAEAHFIQGNFEELETLVNGVLRQAKDPIDTAGVCDIHVRSHTTRNNPLMAIDIGMRYLDMLGVPLLENPDIQAIAKQLPRMDELETHPIMTDPLYLAALRLIKTIAAPMIIASPEMLPRSILTMVRVCLDHGHAKEASYAYVYFGILLCASGDFDSGYHAGRLALKLLEQFDAEDLRGQIYPPFNGFVNHWKTHLRETLDMLLHGFQSALDHGIKECAGYSAFHYCHHLFWVGESLDRVSRHQKRYMDRLEKLKLNFSLTFVRIMHQMSLNLHSPVSDSLRLSGESFDEDDMVPRLIESKSDMLLFSFHLAKTILSYLFGDYSSAVRSAESAARFRGSVLSSVLTVAHNFYHTLALAAHYDTADAEDAARYLGQIRENQKLMRIWACHAPMNYQHKYDLAEAEKNRVLGRNWQAAALYERAGKRALENGYVQEKALASERAGEFYLRQDMHRLARDCMREAHYFYIRWGAWAKARALEEKHVRLLNSDLSAPDLSVKRASTSSTGTGSELDLGTVLKASQAISGEINMDKLLIRLMRIIIENAGAQHGYLILETNGQLCVEAFGSADEQEMGVRQSFLVENSACLSQAIVSYVVRTGESLVLHDAARESRFAGDPYVAAKNPRSVLCMPLFNHGKLMGLLYLENNLTVGAFTPKRLEVLNLLSSQMAISIENAMLYNNLEQKVAERTQELNEALSALWGEMELAKKIQTVLLPKEPKISGYEIKATCEPAEEVGGDYYDVISAAGYEWIVIGDVSGHGVTSGLVMMMVQTAIHTVLIGNPEIPPSGLLSVINRTIYENIEKMGESKHMTIIVLAMGQNGVFSFSGLHEDILVLRSGTGKVEKIETDGMWIGLEPDISEMLSVDAMTLGPGDCMVLFTDGITEAEDKATGELFGDERLVRVIETSGDKSASQIHKDILESLRPYRTADDVTLFVMKRL